MKKSNTKKYRQGKIFPSVSWPTPAPTQEPAVNSAPISIVVPNTIKEKMEAIVNLSKAIIELSKALNSVHLQANVSNCVVSGSTGPGISIATGHHIGGY